MFSTDCHFVSSSPGCSSAAACSSSSTSGGRAATTEEMRLRMCMSSRALIGCRWHHPVQGLLLERGWAHRLESASLREHRVDRGSDRVCRPETEPQLQQEDVSGVFTERLWVSSQLYLHFNSTISEMILNVLCNVYADETLDLDKEQNSVTVDCAEMAMKQNYNIDNKLDFMRR